MNRLGASVAGAVIMWAAGNLAAQQQMTAADLVQQAAMAAPAQTTATAAKKDETPHIFPPLTWGPNDEWKLQVGGWARLRMENRKDFDLDESIPDDDVIGFQRAHLQTELLYQDLFRAYLDIMDARAFSQNVDYLQTDRWDIHQAFIEARLGCKGSPWRIRLGRQEMSLGEKRLVDSARWSNLGNTWDGGRIIRKTSDSEWNFFILQPVTYIRQQGEIITTARRQNINGQLFWGVYGTMKPREKTEVDLYFLGLNDSDNERTFPTTVKDEEGEFGTSDRYTVGTRLRGPLWQRDGCGELGYGLEAAYQFGRVAEDSLRAAMLHADLNYQWDACWKPKLTLEGNLATGDREKPDGQNNTFSPLFGTTHAPYGIIDYTRLQNLREIALKGSIEPTDKLKVETGIHAFWLDSKTDTWYRPVGNIGPDPTGDSGRELGQEFDIVGTYKLNKFMTVEAGAAHFIGGGYPDAQGHPDNGNFAYLQWTTTF